MDNKYSINVTWSDEDECFVATIEEFPLLSAFGETREEALAEAQVVLEMALESLEESGVKPPAYKKVEQRQFSGQVRLRIARSLHRELTVTAQSEGVSLNSYMATTLSRHQSASRLNDEVNAKLDLLFDRQNQHFATMNRKLGQQRATQLEESDSYWLETSSEKPRVKFIQ